MQYLTEIVKESTRDKVMNAISNFILAEKLKVGEKIPTEIYLSKSLGVSRNILREAIAALEMKGILERKYNKGTYVSNQSNKIIIDSFFHDFKMGGFNLFDLQESRKCLELSITKIVIDRINKKQINILKNKLLKLFETINKNNYNNLFLFDMDFHIEYLKSSKNKMILKLGLINIDLYKKLFMKNINNIEKMFKNINQELSYKIHENILNAIIEKNTNKLNSAIIEHFEVY